MHSLVIAKKIFLCLKVPSDNANGARLCNIYFEEIWKEPFEIKQEYFAMHYLLKSMDSYRSL